MKQVGRNLTDAVDGFLRGRRWLIHDRDPLFSAAFRMTLGAQVTTVRLPPKSPNLNAYAERFVLSIKSECRNHVVPPGERHLRLLVSEYIAHYHIERPHQSLGNELVVARAVRHGQVGKVSRRQRLGGMLNHYERAAA